METLSSDDFNIDPTQDHARQVLGTLRKVSLLNPYAHILTETLLERVAIPKSVMGFQRGWGSWGIGGRVTKEPGIFLSLIGFTGRGFVNLEVYQSGLPLEPSDEQGLLFHRSDVFYGMKWPLAVRKCEVRTESEKDIPKFKIRFVKAEHEVEGLDAWLLGDLVPDLVRRKQLIDSMQDRR